MIKLTVNSVQDTHQFAQKMAKLLPLGTVILLEGNLGTGKTTFTQGFGRALGIQRAIKSPTYTIVKEYPLEKGTFIHIDAYRLEDGGADSIDLPHYLNENTLVVIEWAIFVQEDLPTEYVKVRFSVGETENERHIEVEATPQYQTLLQSLEA
ncbi:MAG: tRNA (adenosine(37)-N6)-threonylcarbamoyltransferase complex ATPase subunit type 1 TsaE [Aerococcaceae bacterium]|nr:tRNA (adenosine(37)-N6)-threonylcarbamoyltransferase complex ATPase subunit type 1 TsaE [Aerococcaceae bacterium]